MTEKKILALSPRPQNELEFLYARRSAIDALIDSLEQYDRFRRREKLRTQKIATRNASGVRAAGRMPRGRRDGLGL